MYNSECVTSKVMQAYTGLHCMVTLEKKNSFRVYRRRSTWKVWHFRSKEILVEPVKHLFTANECGIAFKFLQ